MLGDERNGGRSSPRSRRATAGLRRLVETRRWIALPRIPESKSQISLFFANGTAGELMALSLKVGLMASTGTPGVPGFEKDPPPLACGDEDELVLAPRWRTC